MQSPTNLSMGLEQSLRMGTGQHVKIQGTVHSAYHNDRHIFAEANVNDLMHQLKLILCER